MVKDKKMFLQIQLSEKDRWRFKIEAAKRRVSMGAIVRQAIQKFIDGEGETNLMHEKNEEGQR